MVSQAVGLKPSQHLFEVALPLASTDGAESALDQVLALRDQPAASLPPEM